MRILYIFFNCVLSLLKLNNYINIRYLLYKWAFISLTSNKTMLIHTFKIFIFKINPGKMKIVDMELKE